MQVMQAIETRRSVRKYQPTPVEADKLACVAEAFRQSPSARNAQNWKLYIVQNPQVRQKVLEATATQPDFLKQAPVVLVACGTSPGVMGNAHRSDSIDLSIGLAYAVLEAWEQGLGTCWMASYDEERMKQALGLPDGMSVVAISPLGYPDESPEAKPRKPMAEVVEII